MSYDDEQAIYDVQVGRFYAAAFEAGRAGVPFDADALAEGYGVDVNDATFRQAEAKWRYGQVRSLRWSQALFLCTEDGAADTALPRLDGGELSAAAVTSGGTNVLVTIHERPLDDPRRVSVDEVTPDGRPWRQMGTYRNVGEAFDVWGLRAP